MKHKKKEIGRDTFFNVKREEIGRIRLTDWTSLVVSIVNDEQLDLRLWIDSDDFIGWSSKQGLKVRMFGENWKGLKKLMEKVDKAYEAYEEKLLIQEVWVEEVADPGGVEHTPFLFSGEGRKVGCKI